MQILVHIARKLDALHTAGWVHRDLKPPNTIWLPSKNEWALVDFAAACERGRPCELSFSLYYAPPEVMVAYRGGQASIAAEPSTDVWALGVRCRLPNSAFALCACVCCIWSLGRCMSTQYNMGVRCPPPAHSRVAVLRALSAACVQIMTFELLSKTKFYGEGATMDSVVAALTGQAPFLTESPLTPELRASLGSRAFRNSVLSMLSRDPRERPSAGEVVRDWTAVFQATQT